LKVLEEDAVYKNYVNGLIDHGASFEPPVSGVVGDSTKLATIATPASTVLALSDQLQISAGGGKRQITVRKTQAILSALEWVAAHKVTFLVGNIPTNDPFERVALARVLISIGSVVIVEH
jgi:hypothetical protein